MRLLAAVSLTAFLLQPCAGRAQAPEPGRREDIRQILVLTKLGEQGVQAARQTMEKECAGKPGLPPGFMEKFFEELTPGRFVETMVPVWEKLFTDAEIKALLAFARTPEGKSFFGKQGRLNEEAMKAGQLLGMEIGLKVVQKMQAEVR